MVCCVSVSLRNRWPMSRRTVVPMVGSTGTVVIRATIIRGMAVTISRVRRTTTSFVATTAASSSTTARTKIRTTANRRIVHRQTTTVACARPLRPRNCRPTTCRSNLDRTLCSKLRSRGVVTIKTNRDAMTPISTGMATSAHRRPMATTSGKVVRAATAMAGGLARSTGRGM
ncbi:hypothetical protein D3C86_1638460 [compost metagenome]